MQRSFISLHCGPWASLFSVSCLVSTCGHHPLPAPSGFCDLGEEPGIKYATFYPLRSCWWGQTTSHSSASHSSGNELLHTGLGPGPGLIHRWDTVWLGPVGIIAHHCESQMQHPPIPFWRVFAAPGDIQPGDWSVTDLLQCSLSFCYFILVF